METVEQVVQKKLNKEQQDIFEKLNQKKKITTEEYNMLISFFVEAGVYNKKKDVVYYLLDQNWMRCEECDDYFHLQIVDAGGECDADDRTLCAECYDKFYPITVRLKSFTAKIGNHQIDNFLHDLDKVLGKYTSDFYYDCRLDEA
ncbi:MAG: hypothetical protein ACOCQR_01015 [bacterium]